MLMNFSEKINNSKYNMPLKTTTTARESEREAKERVIFIFKSQFPAPQWNTIYVWRVIAQTP